MEKHDVAIVILNYKNYFDTIQCIKSILEKETYSRYTIIVVDNDSRNNSLEHIYEALEAFVNIQFWSDELKQVTEQVKVLLVQHAENSGYAAGNNVGLQLGFVFGFKYLMVLNNDVLFKYNILGRLVSCLKTDSSAICVGPVLENGNGGLDYNCAKRRPMKSDFFVLSNFGKFLRTKSWQNKYYYLRNAKYKDLKTAFYVDIISGSCMLFKARAFKEIGFFDENTFLYYEEAIITEKARSRDYKILLDPAVTVVHLGGQTTKKYSLTSFLLGCEYQSAIYYLTKYRQLRTWKAKLICIGMYSFLIVYKLKASFLKN